MNIIYLLLPLALFLGMSFIVAFVIAARRGQFDDLDTPSYRMLLEADTELETKKGRK